MTDEQRIARLECVVSTLITWLTNPLSHVAVVQLLEILNSEKPDAKKIDVGVLSKPS